MENAVIVNFQNFVNWIRRSCKIEFSDQSRSDNLVKQFPLTIIDIKLINMATQGKKREKMGNTIQYINQVHKYLIDHSIDQSSCLGLSAVQTPESQQKVSHYTVIYTICVLYKYSTYIFLILYRTNLLKSAGLFTYNAITKFTKATKKTEYCPGKWSVSKKLPISFC